MLLLFHFVVDFQLYIHWIHRVILVVILLFSIAFTVGMDVLWSDGWRLMSISLLVYNLCVPLLTFCACKSAQIIHQPHQLIASLFSREHEVICRQLSSSKLTVRSW